MTTSLFPQPPDNEVDREQWRRDLHNVIFGEENSGGSLDGDNITNITDPTDADGTLADITTKFNNLLAELRTLGIM
jgi:hypothetical protein